MGGKFEEDPAHLPPGEYITNHRCGDPDEWDIQKVRTHLLHNAGNPEINICSMHDGYHYNKLSFTREDGTVTIRSTQNNWSQSREFARAFPMGVSDNIGSNLSSRRGATTF